MESWREIVNDDWRWKSLFALRIFSIFFCYSLVLYSFAVEISHTFNNCIFFVYHLPYFHRRLCAVLLAVNVGIAGKNDEHSTSSFITFEEKYSLLSKNNKKNKIDQAFWCDCDKGKSANIAQKYMCINWQQVLT